MSKNIHYSPQTNQGFTLVEILLSLALIALIAGISAPVYSAFQTRNDLDIAATTTAQTLRRAQLLSQAMDGDITWGIKIQTGSLTLFKGANYASRDVNFDETFELPVNMGIAGDTEIVFIKFSGEIASAKSITFTSVHNETRDITINQKGIISF